MPGEHRRTHFYAAGAAVAVSVLLAALVGGGAFFWSELEQANADNAALAEQVRTLGGKPVVEPPKPSDKFTESQTAAIRVIVAQQIADTPAKLSQNDVSQIARTAASLVPKPGDGSTPTASQLRPVVAAALAAFCVDDKCVGRPGDEGKPGVDGKDGKDAPPVTDEQLLASAQQALAIYCAQDSKPCAGTPGLPGTDGQPGKDGADGRGVKSVTCQNDGTWLITYTDDKTSTTDGPCRILPITPPG